MNNSALDTSALKAINDKMTVLFLRDQAKQTHKRMGLGKGPEMYKEWGIADRFEELLVKEKELEELEEIADELEHWLSHTLGMISEDDPSFDEVFKNGYKAVKKYRNVGCEKNETL